MHAGHCQLMRAHEGSSGPHSASPALIFFEVAIHAGPDRWIARPSNDARSGFIGHPYWRAVAGQASPGRGAALRDPPVASTGVAALRDVRAGTPPACARSLSRRSLRARHPARELHLHPTPRVAGDSVPAHRSGPAKR